MFRCLLCTAITFFPLLSYAQVRILSLVDSRPTPAPALAECQCASTGQCTCGADCDCSPAQLVSVMKQGFGAPDTRAPIPDELAQVGITSQPFLSDAEAEKALAKLDVENQKLQNLVASARNSSYNVPTVSQPTQPAPAGDRQVLIGYRTECDGYSCRQVPVYGKQSTYSRTQVGAARGPVRALVRPILRPFRGLRIRRN